MPVEGRPAEDDLERLTGEAPLHQGTQTDRIAVACLEQQVGLVLGEHAARRPEPGGERVPRCGQA
ncbi:hypothetical protein, partial [Curtobacterium sp. Csp2]|uniref:hypothetical protein n=1 Tax=Curtobacterium sp. Csp2 TaxID=2495430 RepID=UPI001C2ED0F5